MTRIMSIDALALVCLLSTTTFSGVDHVQAFTTIAGRSLMRKPFACVTSPPHRSPKSALAAGLFASDFFVTGLSQVLAEEPSSANIIENLDAMEARLDYLATQLSDLSNKAIEMVVMDDHNSMSQIATVSASQGASDAAQNLAAGSVGSLAGGTAVGAGLLSQGGQPGGVDDQSWSATSQALMPHGQHAVAAVAATSGTAVAATTQLVDNSASAPQVVVENTVAASSAAAPAVESFASQVTPPPEAPVKMVSEMLEQASQVAAAPLPPVPPPAVVENTNPFMEAMEDAMDAIQEVAQKGMDSFASQLDQAGLSYETVSEASKPVASAVVEASKPVASAVVEATKPVASAVVENVQPVASAVVENVVAAKTAAVAASSSPPPQVDPSVFFDSLSNKFSGGFSQGMSLTFNEIGDRLVAASAHVGQATASEATRLASTLAENVVSTEKQLAAQAAAQLQSAGESNLVEIGSAVMAGLAKMGTILMTLLNLILESAFDTSIPEIIMNAQNTANGVVSGAVDAITQTISEIGSRSVADAAVSFANLMLLIGKVLFKLLNGIVAVITGSDVTEWTQIAGSTMVSEAHKLGDAVVGYTHQLSEMSVTQLVAVIESFANSAGNTMVTIVGTALDTM